MKTEELKAIGLTDDQITAVMKQNGQDVENVKAKYSDYDDVKNQLADAGKAIEELKGKAGNAEAIQKAADEWKQKAEKAEQDAKAKLDAIRFDHALERALSKAGARNNKAVRALLDAENLKMNDGGPDGIEEIAGLKDQLEKVKSENGFLFADEDGSAKSPRFSTGVGGKSEPASDSAIRAVMGLSTNTK